jgi:hypothetical protein
MYIAVAALLDFSYTHTYPSLSRLASIFLSVQRLGLGGGPIL